MTRERPEVVLLDDFLDGDAHRYLLDHARSCSTFGPAHVTRAGESTGTEDPQIRKALTSTAEPLRSLFEAPLRSLLPHIRLELGVARFELGDVELQLTAHQDGDFFDVHQDLTTDRQRRVSFTYYLRDPDAPFEGGELRVFDHDRTTDERLIRADTFVDIEPRDNSIAFFAPWAFHEVRPIRSRSGNGVRYAITGWFIDADNAPRQPTLRPEQQTELAARYVPSFTRDGFDVQPMPRSTFLHLTSFFESRLPTATPEAGAATDDFLVGTPDFLPVDDVRGDIVRDLQPIHQEWAGLQLVPSACHGIRIYREGQQLLPHIDRVGTHVISSVLHLAHDLDAPWPLRITDLHGREHDILLKEGEMLLYESARCIHSRPEPLIGRSYASVFLHFRPLRWNVSWQMLVDQARVDGHDHLLPDTTAAVT